MTVAYAADDNTTPTLPQDSLHTAHADAFRDHVSVAALATVGYMTPVAGLTEELLHSHTTLFYDARFRYQTGGNSCSPYDALFAYPVLQTGIVVGDLTHIDVYRQGTTYRSTLGCMIAPYFGFQRFLFRGGRWAIAYEILNGISFNTHPYDDQTNIDNEYIGAPLSIFFGLGVSARYRLTPQWSLSLSADFKHNSAASMARPNLGINAFGPTLGVTYNLTPQSPIVSPPQQKMSPDDKRAENGFYGELSAAVIPKALPDYFNVYHTSNCPVYASYNAMGSFMYRYLLHHASGLAVDYTYVPYTHRLKELDALQHHDVVDGRPLRYSPHLFGLLLRHDVFYRHVSVNLGLGLFLHRRQGWRAETQESSLYQLIGLHYSLPFTNDRLTVGYTIRAFRFSKVDGMLFGLGWRFRRPASHPQEP